MKSEIDHFRKFSLIDYRANTKKYKEYLEYCKKNHILSEKKYLMESLVNIINEKSNMNNSKIISDLTTLCVLAIVFSDFEIELFFDIKNFTPNFQKNILYQTINFCCDRHKDQEEYISLKLQFWVIKSMNKMLSLNSNINSSIISSNELMQSLESINQMIQQNEFDNSDDSTKILIIKITYELGMYYFYINNNEEMEKNFNFLINNCNDIINPNNDEVYQFYFDINKVHKMLNYSNKLSRQMDLENNNSNKTSIFELDEVFENENIPNFSFNIDDNDQNSKNNLIDDNTECNYLISSADLIDYSSFTENFKKLENLINLSLKNYTILQEALSFGNTFQESINTQISKSYYQHEINIFKNILREVNYYILVLKEMESLFRGEVQLDPSFLKSLSVTIMNNTLTDNLRINGLMHSLILNYSNNFKIIFNYFKDFVDFFMNTDLKNPQETINLIVFICTNLSIFNLFLNKNSLANNNYCIKIEGELHFTMIYHYLYWLGKEDKDLKHKNNIVYIIIEAVNNVEYLYILKIIYLSVLKFILDNKHFVNNNYGNDILNYIYGINPSIFKIDKFIEDEFNDFMQRDNIKINYKLTLIQNAFSIYKFDYNLINIYLENIFKCLNKIDKKIIKYDKKISEYDILKKLINISFIDILENNIKTSKSEIQKEKEKNFIFNYIKMINIKFKNFKEKYFNLDLFSNIQSCVDLYNNEFIDLMDKDLLFKLIVILTNNKKYFEAAILSQYIKKTDYDLSYKLINYSLENTVINFELYSYIWKTVYFEYLSNYYFQNKKIKELNIIKVMIKRNSNHQFFNKHPLRKHFKIINFFKLLDYLTNMLTNNFN